MATTFVEYTGDGQASKQFTFPSYQESDVKVRVDGVLKTTSTHYNITSYTTTGGGNVVFTSGNIPSSPANIRIYRDTNVDTAKATFTAGSSVKAADLNNNTTQLLYRAQEEQIPNLIHSYDIDDGAITSAKLVADSITSDKIADDQINSEHYVDGSIDTQHIADGQIISSKIADGTIVNADINASAAIAGTKIAPDFGSQNIATTGTVDGRDVSADGTKLDGIEAGATADQTNAEIRAAVEAATDSNVFTDADHTKLNGIETGATADQTASDIKTLIAGSPLDASHLAANSVGSSEIASNAVTTDKIADNELSILAGMQSGTASKLAAGTALTADIADLNQIDGMAKQTTITDDDTKFPTSGAVVDYVAAQLEPFGGFEAIANESSFPNTQPVSGVAISIADAGGMAVSSSGTASGATVGGTTVNISGIPSNFHSSTVAAGIRFIVTSTGSGQNYTYHKATLKEDDLVSLSGDINDFSERYRVGASNPTTSLDSGDLFFNTGSGKLLVYNGTNSAWEETQTVGNFFINTISSSSSTGGGSATPNGTAYRFTLSNAGANAQQHLVSVDGVIQKPNSGTSQPSEGFAIDGGDIIFGSAPVNGASIFVITIGASVSIGTPSNNTVTSAILQNGSVINSKLVDDAVSTSKIQDDAVTADKLANSINSAIAANTAKTTNATHTGEVTGATALTIADNVVDEANLKVSNSPVNGYFLSAQSGNTGGLTWAQIDLTALSASNLTSGTVPDARFPATLPAVSGANLTGINTDLLSDTSPQLGGNLDTNSFEIDLDDSHAVRFGDSQDLQIAFNGSNGLIENTTGNLILKDTSGSIYLQSSNIFFQDDTTNEDIAKFISDGAVELYYDNVKKFGTTSQGATVTGTLTTTAGAIINGVTTIEADSDERVRIEVPSNNGDDWNYISYYGRDGNRDGFIGTWSDGTVTVYSDASGGHFIKFHSGSIEFNNHLLPNANNSLDLGSSNSRWRNIYTNDLNLSNEGSSNDVDGSWGDWTIQEGESDLFLKNNRSGKKYKFNLTEVS